MTCIDQHKESIREFLMRNILFTGGEFPHDDDASLLEQGIVDSMGVLEVVMFVQSTFGFAVNPDDVTRANFDSVNRLAHYIARQSGGEEANRNASAAVLGE